MPFCLLWCINSLILNKDKSTSLKRCLSCSSVCLEELFCRICHEDQSCGELLSPCECSGSLATVHRTCLEQWLTTSNMGHCELCRHQFALERLPKPLTEVIIHQYSYKSIVFLKCSYIWNETRGRVRWISLMLMDLLLLAGSVVLLKPLSWRARLDGVSSSRCWAEDRTGTVFFFLFACAVICWLSPAR